MSKRVIDQTTYDLLLQAYREQPGNATHAGRVARCDRRMALRAWKEGWPTQPWAVPIEGVLASERISARIKAAEESERRLKFEAEQREKGRQDAVDTLAAEGQLLRLARADLQASLVLAGSLVSSMKILVERTKAAIENGEFKPREGLRVLEVFTRVVAKAAEATDRVIEAERRKNGDPTETISIQVDGPELSTSEALQELEAVKELLSAAVERGHLSLVPPSVTPSIGNAGFADGATTAERKGNN